MSEATSGYATFRPRARLLKLIGEELISDEVVAVTELVKNAHDADATTVTLRFRGVTGPGGTIEIEDDGCGMDRETFLGGWMQPAGSTKVSAKARITPGGRRVLGEKGVGRFSADKLGSRLELISLRAGHNGEVRAEFDWDVFDSDGDMLADIRHRWEIRPASAIREHGTILRVGGLRVAWTERMFRRLSTRLGRLQSPTGSRHGFTIIVDSDEFPRYSGEVRSSLLDRAPYSIRLAFDGRDTFHVELCGKKSRSETAGPGTGQLTCGPICVNLYAFDLETEAIARVGPRLDVRAWLREWSGVSVYRDGFRIWPYGEPHDDWLRLDQRRVNNPVLRLSNNQVVGFVDISRDRNPDLVDQTNREGLIHNQALEDLRKIIEHAFALLEAERQRIRHPTAEKRGDARRKPQVTVAVADTLDRLVKQADRIDKRELRRIAAEARDSAATKQAELEHLVHAYNDLAAAGQAAISIGESLSSLVSRLRGELAGGGPVIGAARSIVNEIEQHLEMLGTIGAAAPLRRRTMDVLAEIGVFRSAVAPLLSQRAVRLTFTHEGGDIQRVDMHPYSFRRVLHILLANSLDWFIKTPKPRVSIHSQLLEGHCRLTFSDNGPGFARSVADRACEPLVSLKEGGRGMGLTIARGLVQEIGGSLQILPPDGRRRGGAHVRLLLPRKRSRATPHTA